MEPTTKKRKAESTENDAEQLISVGFQGQEGSFTSIAAHTFFGQYNGRINYVSKKNAKETFNSIIEGEVTYGITPIESSSYGTIHGVLHGIGNDKNAEVSKDIYHIFVIIYS